MHVVAHCETGTVSWIMTAVDLGMLGIFLQMDVVCQFHKETNHPGSGLHQILGNLSGVGFYTFNIQGGYSKGHMSHATHFRIEFSCSAKLLKVPMKRIFLFFI